MMTVKPFKTPKNKKSIERYRRKYIKLLNMVQHEINDEEHRKRSALLFSKYVFAIEKYKQKKDYLHSAKRIQLENRRYFQEVLHKKNIIMNENVAMKIKCTECQEIISSKRGGEFVSCACFKRGQGKGIYMDRDRWFPDRYRIGGKEESYEVIKGEE